MALSWYWCRQQWLLKHVSSLFIFKRFDMFVLLTVPWISSPNLWDFRGQKAWRIGRNNWRSTSSTRSSFLTMVWYLWLMMQDYHVHSMSTNKQISLHQELWNPKISISTYINYIYIRIYIHTLFRSYMLHCYIFSKFALGICIIVRYPIYLAIGRNKKQTRLIYKSLLPSSINKTLPPWVENKKSPASCFRYQNHSNRQVLGSAKSWRWWKLKINDDVVSLGGGNSNIFVL